MENIYKIRIRTVPDPRGQYPSERRYSASTVLGLGVIHIFLAIFALIFTTLSLLNVYGTKEQLTGVMETGMLIESSKETTNYLNEQEILNMEQENANKYLPTENSSLTSELDNESKHEELFNKTIERRKREVTTALESIHCTYLSLACFVMTVGALLAGVTGILAWKQWYNDNNIKWFFLTSCISTVCSGVALICTIVTIIVIYENLHAMSKALSANAHFKYSLTVNILIASAIEFIWSCLSVKISFQGMRNVYPDDIIASKNRGKIEVNTKRKGNKKTKLMPPDILNHFHMTGKFAKYFPRRESNNLPNAESNSEYQERVRKFLSSDIDSTSIK